MDSSLKKRKVKKEIEAKKKKALQHHDEESNVEEDDMVRVNECEEGMMSPPITFSNKLGKK